MRRVPTLLIGMGLLGACAGVADLDVQYAPGLATSSNDAGGDATVDPDRQNVRPSTVEIPDAQTGIAPPQIIGDCPTGLGEACDPGAGFGCCVTSSTTTCMGPLDYPRSCIGPAIFLGCSQSDPSSESECCWRQLGGVRTAFLVADCAQAGGRVACVADGGACPNGLGCQEISCHGVRIGECGTEPPTCP